MFRQVWDDGKSILIGAEALDGLVMNLASLNIVNTNDWKQIHIEHDSDEAIKRLIDLFPWDHHENDASANTKGHPSLSLDDFEIQMNLRIPRYKHIVSTWHQEGHGTSLREFLLWFDDAMSNKGLSQLYFTNTLACALQFVEYGIKTTIVDMEGVSEKTEKENER
mmetsp:Transcript_45926/g.46616  ORF Transcript_45926/g.46616 Transcript_45926/m.46616 type:complete len:165 (+) Transcript_45926:360-854(+)